MPHPGAVSGNDPAYMPYPELEMNTLVSQIRVHAHLQKQQSKIPSARLFRTCTLIETAALSALSISSNLTDFQSKYVMIER